MNTLHFENNSPLESCNTFGIAARARQRLRVQHPAQLQELAQQPDLLQQGLLVLGWWQQHHLYGQCAAAAT